jgi:hypothetical protein
MVIVIMQQAFFGYNPFSSDMCSETVGVTVVMQQLPWYSGHDWGTPALIRHV